MNRILIGPSLPKVNATLYARTYTLSGATDVCRRDTRRLETILMPLFGKQMLLYIKCNLITLISLKRKFRSPGNGIDCPVYVGSAYWSVVLRLRFSV